MFEQRASSSKRLNRARADSQSPQLSGKKVAAPKKGHDWGCD